MTTDSEAEADLVIAVCALVDSFRDLLPILAEHLVDYDQQVIPHLVLSDVIRWIVANRVERPDVCRSILAWLDDKYAHASVDVRGMIEVSGVAMLPDPGQPGYELRAELGPHLRLVEPRFR